MVDGEILRGAVSFTGPNASIAQIVLTWILSGGDLPDEDALTEVTAWLIANLIDAWADLADDGAVATVAEYDVMNADGTVSRNIGTGTVNVPGTGSTAHTMPAAVSAYLQGNTAQPKVRGRKFLPFVAEDQVDNGVFNAGALVDMALALADYLTAIPTTGTGVFQPGVISTTLVSFVPFAENGQVSIYPAYQRRRKPNVGS